MASGKEGNGVLGADVNPGDAGRNVAGFDKRPGDESRGTRLGCSTPLPSRSELKASERD